MQIITISFNSSPKTYQYLLDMHGSVTPKIGSVLKRIGGTTCGRSYYTEMRVVGIQTVKVLPEIVTSVIVIQNDGLECTTKNLSSETLARLRTIPKSATAKPVEAKLTKEPAQKPLSNKEILDILFNVMFS